MKRFFASCILWSCILICTQQMASAGLESLTQRQSGEARRESSSNPDLASNGDSVSIDAGQTRTLLDVDGPGMVTHFWNTIAAFDPFAGRSVVLRVYYDGNEKPSVQAPLGDFFGVGHGANKSFSSAVASASAYGLSRACYWHMPFRKHIKITLSNESPTYSVPDFYYYLDWRKLESLPDDTMYFHAQYHQSMPAAPGHYTILNTTGEGHYVGTVYSVQQMETGWFGEGDDFIYIDGADTPQLRGTGTEDYFNDAWGFREFCTPYHGVTLYEGIFPGDRVSAYRWHVTDPIPFKKSIRVTIEHRGSVEDEEGGTGAKSLTRSTERPDWVSSVAFWYQYPAVSIEEPMPPAEKRIAPYRVFPVAQLPRKTYPAEKITPANVGVTFTTGDPKASIEFTFEVAQDGRYRIDAMFEDALTGAVWQPWLDERKIGQPFDTVVPESQFVWRNFDLHELKAGKHTLSFTKTDAASPQRRSMAPPETSLTVEYLVLLRLEDMEGYHRLYKELKAKKR